ALAEVVLHAPHRVEPELVGELDLFDGLRVGLLLGLALAVGMLSRPRLRDVDLVEQIELHGVGLLAFVIANDRSKSGTRSSIGRDATGVKARRWALLVVGWRLVGQLHPKPSIPRPGTPKM